jgi:hypothetical protein
MADADDGVRSQAGVVVCLRNIGNGISKLILDDVQSNSSANPISWCFKHFYTWREFSDEDLNQMKLSDDDYKMIGENIVARLLGLNARVK